MSGLSVNEMLFYGGVALMALAAAASVIALVVFSVSSRRLQKKLEEEYGKRKDA